MRHLTTSLAALALAGGMTATAQANDEIRMGQDLHENNCVSCHADMHGGDGSGMYTRDDRMVGDHDELVSMVRRCDANIGTAFFDDEIEAIVAYLNDEYYGFD
ncbi:MULTISPECIES: cytochrome c [unclassified Thioalkalivibrio]|uniref:c-type cytochrome n=1 Tax=unclassified Thioalkalivibrio TaxID=2621013 RepID=UPI0003819C9C|nr:MULTISPECIES: cytochrome c [unclassified Thioalkalivibrio]